MGQCVSIRSGMHPKATDEAREKWVIADPFEHWRNLAGQCSEYGKCQILSAFRHGQAMVRALRLPNLSVLSLPRSGMERYFLRIPVTQQDMNSESFAMWLLNYLYQSTDTVRDLKARIAERMGGQYDPRGQRVAGKSLDLLEHKQLFHYGFQSGEQVNVGR